MKNYHPSQQLILLICFFTSIIACDMGQQSKTKIDNPYEGIDWEAVHFLHSSTHQHGRPESTPEDWHGRGDDRLLGLYEQGLRHFALSNYMPSAPVYPFYPLPDELEHKDDLISAPNAEHRTPTDFSMHFNTLGSYYRSGFTRNWEVNTREAPYTHIFDNGELTVYDPDGRTSDGAYNLTISLKARDGVNEEPRARVTLTGAVKRKARVPVEPAENGNIENWEITGSDNKYLLFLEESPQVHIEYDPEKTEIEMLRLTQRTLLPWRQAFSEALDGDRTDEDGNPIEGLQFDDGGGIVINHPNRSDYREYLDLLDFDDRVLGMEIWNHRRAFGPQDEAPHDRYYNHWDDILSTGRRMYGFAAMDHRWQGRGRSVLLVPNPEDRTRKERKQDALRAYRHGQFFALLGAIDTDQEGNLLETGDYSEFRVSNLELEKTNHGHPVAIRVAVTGNDPEKRPNIQLRIITDQGTEKIVNEAEARFELPVSANGSVERKYVRIEALAFPNTHNQGESLSAKMIEQMNMYDIAMLHNFRGHAGGFDYYERGTEPIGIVDILFTQPIRFINTN